MCVVVFCELWGEKCGEKSLSRLRPRGTDNNNNNSKAIHAYKNFPLSSFFTSFPFPSVFRNTLLCLHPTAPYAATVTILPILLFSPIYAIVDFRDLADSAAALGHGGSGSVFPQLLSHTEKSSFLFKAFLKWTRSAHNRLWRRRPRRPRRKLSSSLTLLLTHSPSLSCLALPWLCSAPLWPSVDSIRPPPC